MEVVWFLFYEDDVRIFVVGMGNNVDVRELWVIIVDEKDVFLLLLLENFFSLSGFLFEVMCEVVSEYIVKIVLFYKCKVKCSIVGFVW